MAGGLPERAMNLLKKDEDPLIDFGLFQINKSTWNKSSRKLFGKNVDELSSEENIKMARYIYDERSKRSKLPWSPWYGYGKKNPKTGKFETTDRYEKYLSGEWATRLSDSHKSLIRETFGDLGEDVIKEAMAVAAAESM